MRGNRDPLITRFSPSTYVCVYIYIYTYKHTHTHTVIFENAGKDVTRTHLSSYHTYFIS